MSPLHQSSVSRDRRPRRPSPRRGRRRPAGLNKAELVVRVARDTGLARADVRRVLDAILDHVTRALKKGDRVTLVGFGAFLVARRRARAGHNPHTGQPMRIAGGRFARFAAGKELRALVR